MFLLRNLIKNYAWGSFEAIAHLQNREATTLPEAELWIGAHPQGSSQLHAQGHMQSLQALISSDPEACLGERVASKWGAELPFMVKVLAARQPLSIQLHPAQQGAQTGFAAENKARIPMDSPLRNFKDPNPKPEIVSALTHLEALVGFRPLEELQAIELPLKSYALFVANASSANLSGLLTEIYLLPPEKVSKIAQKLADKAPWLANLAPYYPTDPGLLIAVLMNHLQLDRGQAVFLKPGVLHAYLSGVVVEVTANSDNVLRAGFTPKHADRGALVAHCDLHRGPPKCLRPPQYESDEPRFQLLRWEPSAGEHSSPMDGPEIWLCTEGQFAMRTRKNELTITSGQSVFVPFEDRELVVAGSGVIFQARVHRLLFATKKNRADSCALNLF
jgi:mannose-6-phosphate isomerase